MKKLLELFEKLVGISKRTSDPKIINELQTLATKIENLSVNPSLDSLSQTEQIKAVAEDLLKLETKAIDQIDSGISKIDELEDAYGLNDKPSVTNRPQGKSADMYDSAERSIQFVAEKTGLSFEEARLAIMEKINEGYAIGDPKRTRPNELASIKAYLDVNLDYSATDAIMFLEDIEEIAFSGSIDLASDTAKNVSKQNAKQIISSSNPGAEFGETLMDFADPNYDKLVNEGFYVEGSMKPGPAHPFNNPEKAITANLVPDAEGSLTSKVVLNIAQWKRELIKNLEEGIITRAEYDELYRNADQVFDTIYNTAKSTDMSKGFVVGSADNPNAEKVLTDYWPGENYAAKYITEEEIAGTGFKMTDEQITESNFKNSETLDLMEQILEDAKTTNKIVTSQTDELQMYNALLDDARDAGDFMEEERIIDILKDAKAQTESGTELPNLIFNDSKRSLNAMGGIIQGVKNRGK